MPTTCSSRSWAGSRCGASTTAKRRCTRSSCAPWEATADMKPLLIAQREVIAQLKTKGFWIGIFLFPVIIVLSIAGPVYLERAKGVRMYAVRDSSGWLSAAVEREAAAADTRRLLLEAQKRSLENKNIETLPPVLAQLAPVAAKLPPSQLDSAARALALNDTAPMIVLSGEARGAIAAARADYKTWWDTATARTIRR